MIRLTLRESRWAAGLSMALHGLAAAALTLSDLAADELGLALTALAVSGAAHGWWHSRANPRRFEALMIGVQGSVLSCRLGVIPASAPELIYLSQGLIVLRLSRIDNGVSVWLNLWPDSLSTRDDWLLRCYLRTLPT